ncbi:hypothetical protein BD414DRAFT_229061 [Trametes punicea]|nr:hypothetical protein BD414DRAFT_229061 [Trametes punicea]
MIIYVPRKGQVSSCNAWPCHASTGSTAGDDSWLPSAVRIERLKESCPRTQKEPRNDYVCTGLPRHDTNMQWREEILMDRRSDQLSVRPEPK